MWKEFKEFALKGNMFDMAVGIIIGGAFSTIINSLVNDIIMPVVGLFIGGTDFASLFIALDGNKYETIDAAKEAGASVFAYGSFIQNIINFILLALVVFFLVRTVNRLRTKQEEVPAAPTTKECPFCKSVVPIAATRCPNCTSELPTYEEVPDAQ